MNQMEIRTALVGVLFALFLATLSGTPALIRLYLELRAQKRGGSYKKKSALQAAYSTPVPFNYPSMFLEQTLRKIHHPRITNTDARRASASELLETYPTPVPFNYPKMHLKLREEPRVDTD